MEKAELKKLQAEEQALAKRINTESFGREHFFREFGLIFHFAGQFYLPNGDPKYSFMKKYSK